MDPGVISGVRVTYRHADVDVLGAVGSEDVRTDVSGLVNREDVDEAFVLRTCNRVEAYVVTDTPSTGRAVLSEFVAGVSDDAVVETDHEGSLRHLMRVASGLESMVLGEDRVLGQVKEAYETARGVGAVGPVLEEAIPKAIHVGERVRTETGINDGVVTLGSAAAECLDERVGLAGTTALVVGAGDIGSSVAKALAARDVGRLVVANRTIPKAEYLADVVDVDAEGIGLDELPSAVEDATVVVTATGATDPLVEPPTMAGAGETWVVDMSQPRDVDPAAADLSGVHLLDLDDLESVTAETRRRRAEAAEAAEETIDREFEHLLERFKRKRADEVIAAMHEGADGIKRRELRTAVRKLEASGEFTDEQREIVESLADALVGQLLAAPTKALRDAAAEDDWTTIATALRLFDPDFGGEPPSFVTGERTGSEDTYTATPASDDDG